MRHQRGITLSGLLFWLMFIVIVGIFMMRIVPSAIEYYKVLKDARSTAASVAPDSTVADVRARFDKYAEVDSLEFRSHDLDISKDPSGRIVIEFAYEKRIPLFGNVSLVIDYKGSTAN